MSMSLTQGLSQPMQPVRLISRIGLALALGYAIVLGSAYLSGDWLIDAQGAPIAGDFVNVWAAGQLTLDGHPAAAYDWTLHKVAEVRAIGHPFDVYYGWHYPPTFLFAAAALALMPFVAASVIWLAITLPAYVLAVRNIVGGNAGIFVAIGFPAALWNATAGQNGFLTAALIGGTLGLMERHPNLAGICLGLLTYKPQFGLLFPIALIAGKQWRVIAIAAVTALVMASAAWTVFGTESWQAFFHWMPATSRVVLGEGAADWQRLQSLFGFVRAHGGSETLAWIVQISAALTLAAGIFWLWRSRAPFELKAAALSAAALLATPYLYIYDAAVLAVPVAFLLRASLARGLSLFDTIGLAAITTLLLCYPYVKTHVGLAATLTTLALVALHVRTSSRHSAVNG